MDAGPVCSTVTSSVAKVSDAHVEQQLPNMCTAPDQSAFGVGQVELICSVLERRPCALTVSRAALEDPRSCPKDSFAQFLPIGMDSTLQSKVDETSQKNGTPIFVPPTLGSTRCPHVKANIEDSHGIYNGREDAGTGHDGQEV